nr:MAG TPA: hypothetical protein [Caudoviricetes sp.]
MRFPMKFSMPRLKRTRRKKKKKKKAQKPRANRETEWPSNREFRLRLSV